MNAPALHLLRPRRFEAMKPSEGKARFCRNCTQDFHCHRKTPCAQCGRSWRMCALGVLVEALSHCDSHSVEGA